MAITFGDICDTLELAYGSKQKFGANVHSILSKGYEGIGKVKKTRIARLASQSKLTRIKGLAKVGKIGAIGAGVVGAGLLANAIRKRMSSKPKE